MSFVAAGGRPPMDVERHIEAIAAHGAAMADAADSAGPEAAVPTCPEWTVRDLVRHTGGVHRWATGYVRDAAPAQRDVSLDDVVGTWPGDGELAPWLRAGVDELAGALRAAPADLQCWTFLPAPSPLAFWARRQAHETAIHRVDADRAAGATAGFEPDFAADGIDELLRCFVVRPGGRLRSDADRHLLVVATDADAHWMVTIGPERVRTTTGPGAGPSGADTTVRGPASDVYLWLWNRLTPDGLDVRGDTGMVDRWRDAVRVRWS